jgi:hypothetical protein
MLLPQNLIYSGDQIMGNRSIDEFLLLINKQLELQQALNEKISKAHALSRVSLSKDFLENSDDIIMYYLFEMNDVIESSKELSSQSFNLLLQCNRIIKLNIQK